MAASGYFNTSNQYVKFWIEIITNSQNVSANTSNVTVKVWAKRTNTGYTTWGSGSVTLKVNGSYYNSGNKQIEITSSSKVYHSWTGNISHNSDGTKKLTCSAAINIPTVLSSSEQSYSVNLKTIPRTSSFTLSKSSCQLGTSFTVNISRASNSFTHSVSYVIGGERRYIQNWNSSNISPSYTPPITDAVYMPNSATMNVTIIVDTYSGGDVIGTVKKNLKLECPSNMIPTFTNIVPSKVSNGPDANVSCLVQGYSKIKATVNGAKGIYDSKISKYYVSINEVGYSGTSNNYTSGVIQDSGIINVRAEVVDSRGRKSGVYGSTITVEPYEKPKTQEFVVRRVNDNYVYDTEGTKLHVRAVVEFSHLQNQNSYHMEVKWRELNGQWSVGGILYSGEDYYFDDRYFSADKQYEVAVVITDKITSVTYTKKVSTGEVTMDFKKGGRGVAIGKVSEEDFLFDIGFDTTCRKGLQVTDQLKLDRNIWMKTSMYIYGQTDDNINRKMIGCSSYGNLVIGDDVNTHPSINMYGENLKLSGTHIVSHGSNSNGEWIRFYNGIQICMKKVTFEKLNITNPWGGGYTGTGNLGNFPVVFTADPYMIITPIQASGAQWWCSMGVEHRNTSAAGWGLIFRGTSISNAIFYVNVLAIGRWK